MEAAETQASRRPPLKPLFWGRIGYGVDGFGFVYNDADNFVYNDDALLGREP